MRRFLPVGLAFGFGAALLLSGLGAGIGEPRELDAADRARRFAIEALGARSLAVEGLVNTPLAAGDLAQGRLSLRAVALGFRLFGLHGWAGRVPVALAALAGVAAVGFFLARLAGRRAAAYGMVVLASMPLFFLGARTLTGEALPMAAGALAFAGLGVAALDVRHAGSLAVRLGSLGLGGLGLVAGWLARGPLLGVAVPALGVGLAWLLLRGRAAAWPRASSSGAPRKDEEGEAPSYRRSARATEGPLRLRPHDAFGLLALLVGAWAGVAGALPWLGVATSPGPGARPTFDAVLHHLGHALFPWSALLPVALPSLLSPPSRPGALAGARGEAARVAVLTTAAVAFGAHALEGAEAAATSFVAPAVLAAGIALGARDLDRSGPGVIAIAPALGSREAPAARVAGLVGALFTALLARDLLATPSLSLASVGAARAGTALTCSGTWLRAAAVVFASVLVLAVFERPGGRAVGRDTLRAWSDAVLHAWGGRLATGLLAVEGSLASVALLLVLRPSAAAPLGAVARAVAQNAFWALPVAAVAAAVVPAGSRELLHALRRRAGLPRGALVIAGGGVAGALLAWGHYPALLGQLSPRAALTRYAELRAPGEPLGALGVGARAAAFEVGDAVRALDGPPAAYAFLTGEGAAVDVPGRRWLAARREDLAPLNALFRAGKGRNAAVLAGGDGQVVLVASDRRAGDPPGEGPLDRLVLDAAPPLAHPLDATLGEALVALGWELRDGADTRGEDALVALRAYRLRFYYRVVGHLDDAFCSFVHVDGQGRRFNAEHREFPAYPLRFWRPGDVMVDEFEVTLGANFTPGDYALRYGFDRLPCDGRARLAVSRGPHDGTDRVDGGNVHVR